MSGYVKICLIVAGFVAILTFAVSIPVNLLGTSLIRSLIAFLFYIVVSFGARLLFRLFSSEQTKVDEGIRESPTGEHIDLQTPEDTDLLDGIYSLPDDQPTKPEPFEPLNAPKLEPEQLADVIRKQSLNHQK